MYGFTPFTFRPESQTKLCPFLPLSLSPVSCKFQFNGYIPWADLPLEQLGKYIYRFGLGSLFVLVGEIRVLARLKTLTVIRERERERGVSQLVSHQSHLFFVL